MKTYYVYNRICWSNLSIVHDLPQCSWFAMFVKLYNVKRTNDTSSEKSNLHFLLKVMWDNRSYCLNCEIKKQKPFLYWKNAVATIPCWVSYFFLALQVFSNQNLSLIIIFRRKKNQFCIFPNLIKHFNCSTKIAFHEKKIQFDEILLTLRNHLNKLCVTEHLLNCANRTN